MDSECPFRVFFYKIRYNAVVEGEINAGDFLQKRREMRDREFSRCFYLSIEEERSSASN